ncbi:MAG: hypothetical protein PHH51_01050 [Bacilli bacterium]|nr:hypothetical protein [Bacilli bacterium]
MKRYFVDITKAKTIYLDEITLLNNNLVIKSVNKAGDIILNPVLSISGFRKNQIEEYTTKCKSRNEELLFEVYDNEIKNRDILLEDVYVFEEIKNGFYRDATKPVNNEVIKLIEFGALKHILKNVSINNFDIVMVTPDISNDGTLFFYDKNNSVIKVNQSINTIRYELNTKQLGSDLYIQTTNSEILDDCRTWITEITDIGNNNCYINNKNYYLVKPLSNEELNNLSQGDIKLYRNLTVSSIPVKKQRVNNHIITTDTDSNDYDNYLWVRRENIEELLADGLDKMPLKEYIEVYTQNKDKFIKNSLEDTLDKPKTYLNKKTLNNKEPSNKAHKIDIFYMRIPGLPIPKIIRAGNPVEFKQVGYTDEGYPIWKETVKLVQNKSNEEFAYDLALKGNKYFIKISGLPNENDIFNKLKDTGLLYEFVRYENDDYPSKKNINYYVSRPYIKNSNKVMTKQR